jgi:hypothetical protein
MDHQKRITALSCLAILVAACASSADEDSGSPSDSGGTTSQMSGASGGPVNSAGSGNTSGSAGSTTGAGGTAGGHGGGANGGAAGSGVGGSGVGGSGGAGTVDGGMVGVGGGVASGKPGVWEHVVLPGAAAGDQFQSLAHDPVRPGDFYYASGHNGDHRAIKWWKSTDFGASWNLVNNTSMHGDPWGFSIDPNPSRNPETPPTMWSPAGYGDNGAWKSTDGAKTWTRATGADTAFAPFNPNGATATDLYHLQILPDDPPNHVLATYHYGFKDSAAGGFGETWDGGTTWVVHPPAAGMGTSHYVIPISATTWCVIGQDNGVWRTTTAGRTGGTAANKYRDGTISSTSWAKVDDISHMHGSHTSILVDGVWYVPGISSAKKSTDQGATWQPVASGFSISAIAATTSFLYGSYGFNPSLSRASRTADTKWDLAYTKTPSEMTSGPSPFGSGSGYDAKADQWVVLTGSWETGLWRYVEP